MAKQFSETEVDLRQVPRDEAPQSRSGLNPPPRAEEAAGVEEDRYLWLKNPENLQSKQRALLLRICPSRSHLKTTLVYRIKCSSREFWSEPMELAEPFLERWYYWRGSTTHGHDPEIRVAKTIRKHWYKLLC